MFDAQRSGPSETHRPDLKAKRALVCSSDDDDDDNDDEDESIRRCRKRGSNSFILYKAKKWGSLENEIDDAFSDSFYFKQNIAYLTNICCRTQCIFILILSHSSYLLYSFFILIQ